MEQYNVCIKCNKCFSIFSTSVAIYNIKKEKLVSELADILKNKAVCKYTCKLCKDLLEKNNEDSIMALSKSQTMDNLIENRLLRDPDVPI